MKKQLLILAFLNALCVGAQQLMCEKIVNYPALRFTEHFKTNSSFFVLEGRPLTVDQLTVIRLSDKAQVKVQDLSKELNKGVRKKIDVRYDFEYFLSKDILIVKNRNLILLFDFKDNKFRFNRAITLNLKYQNTIFLEDTTLFIYGVYNNPKRDERFQCGVLSYNLNTNKEELKEIPFKYLSLTHMRPNKFIDFNHNGYLVCDPFTYKIYEYNFNHQLRDSIYPNDSLFTVAKDPEYFSVLYKPEDLQPSPADHFGSMTNYLNGIDRIWTANYLDDSTLFVRLTRNSLNRPEKKSQLFYDHIWIRKDGSWKLTQVKEISSFRTEQTITANDLWPYFFPGSKMVFDSGILYYLVWSPAENKFPQTAHDFFGFSTSDRNKLSLKVIEFKVK
jgi:hypothetical protein